MKRTTIQLALAAGFAFLLLTSVARGEATGKSPEAKAAPAKRLVPAGSKAVPFTLPDLDGRSVNLEEYLGQKAVLVTFWSFFCGPCREEMPHLDDAAKKFAGKDLEVLAINLDGLKMERAIRRYATGFSFRVLWERIDGTSYATADAYGVPGTPSLVLVGRDGKVSWSHVGRVEPSVLEREIRKAIEPAG
jgi:thiol-disulfide isomerase/thioredoxin